jgi:prophage regulatory protein
MPENFLKLPAVITRTALSRSEVYRRLNAGEFPRPIKLGMRSIAWQSSKIDEWIENKIAASAK